MIMTPETKIRFILWGMVPFLWISFFIFLFNELDSKEISLSDIQYKEGVATKFVECHVRRSSNIIEFGFINELGGQVSKEWVPLPISHDCSVVAKSVPESRIKLAQYNSINVGLYVDNKSVFPLLLSLRNLNSHAFSYIVFMFVSGATLSAFLWVRGTKRNLRAGQL